MFVIKMHLAPGKFIEVNLQSFFRCLKICQRETISLLFYIDFGGIECLILLRLLSGKLDIVLQRDAQLI